MDYRSCRASDCENAGRYTSGYCGICDIAHNEGKGELLRNATTKTPQTTPAVENRSGQPESAGGPAPGNGQARHLAGDVASPDAEHAGGQQGVPCGTDVAAVSAGSRPVPGVAAVVDFDVMCRCGHEYGVHGDNNGEDYCYYNHENHRAPECPCKEFVPVQTGGLKFDADKLPYHLVPPGTIVAIARVLAFGGAKYAVENWRDGFDWHQLYNGIWRHLTQFWAGEENDSQSGEPHLAHLLCMAAFLYEHSQQGLGNDDRHKLDYRALGGFDVRELVERGKEAAREQGA